MLAKFVNQRGYVASNLTGLSPRIIPFLARNEQVVFRDAATGLETARSERLAGMNKGANLVAGFCGRLKILGLGSNAYEVTVDRRMQ
ncbi:MAG: hypothetical protein OXN84_04715 [Albidovulum sp.]|nr:hypothetical protein [Albidovulum sp.]